MNRFLKLCIEWKKATTALLTSPELARFDISADKLPAYIDQIVGLSSDAYDSGMRAGAKLVHKTKAEAAAPKPKKTPKAAKKPAKTKNATPLIATKEDMPQDKRPPVLDALVQVMKPGMIITVQDALELLKKKHWQPTSKNIIAYLTMVLCGGAKKGGPFERVEVGKYRLSAVKPKAKTLPPPKVVMKVLKKAEAPKTLNGHNHANGAAA